MSFEPHAQVKHHQDWAINAHAVGKCYSMFDRPVERLRQLLLGRWSGRHQRREFWAMRDVSFCVAPGEVVGVVGRNGAGKSTLLQMICGTLRPSTGSLVVRGRVAALLELGAGFNPDFTGIENVHMNAAILGLSKAELSERIDGILAFADIGEFINQPVKTYSSGMFMRLAFAVATSVDPEVLVIDEALSVGDGAFARKSFDRIMGLKQAGKTILFCSHSMYQVEAMCTRAIWIDEGRIRMDGPAADVTSAYNASLAAPTKNEQAAAPISHDSPVNSSPAAEGTGRILRVTATSGTQRGSEVALRSCESDLTLMIDFVIDPGLPIPGVAIGFSDSSERTVASALSVADGEALQVTPDGVGCVCVTFPRIPLLKGLYHVTAILCTEDGVHPYDIVMHCVALKVSQKGLEQGVVSLPHVWHPPHSEPGEFE